MEQLKTMTLGQAAKAVGKSKSTLTRAIHSGRLSAKRLEDRSYQIDPAELSRVFQVSPFETGTVAHHAPPESNTEELPAVLRVKLEAAEAALGRERELNDDLTRRLDRAEERVLMLSAPQTAGDGLRGLLGRLWGRG
jgi:excisionase family DNA binding protein|tara:strand:- start:3746 stop:4156 length:411 start_codon:yes stop_codon:yes gene_type:complete